MAGPPGQVGGREARASGVIPSVPYLARGPPPVSPFLTSRVEGCGLDSRGRKGSTQLCSQLRGSRAGLGQVLRLSTAKHGEHMSACAMAQADVASSGPVCTLDVHRGGPAAQRGHWDFCFETPRCGDMAHRRNCQMEVKSVCCTCVPPSMDHRPACMSTGTLQDCEGWGRA